MPLIKCPMCGKEISPNAVYCPNCGEPMKKEEPIEEQDEPSTNYCLVLESAGIHKFTLKLRIINIINESNFDNANPMIENCPSLISNNLKLEDAEHHKKSLEDVGAKVSIMSEREWNNIKNNLVKREIKPIEDNTIRCPNCKSTKVNKIGGLSKAGSVALFGVFAMGKVSKTYECKNCGYRW